MTLHRHTEAKTMTTTDTHLFLSLNADGHYEQHCTTTIAKAKRISHPVFSRSFQQTHGDASAPLRMQRLQAQPKIYICNMSQHSLQVGRFAPRATKLYSAIIASVLLSPINCSADHVLAFVAAVRSSDEYLPLSLFERRYTTVLFPWWCPWLHRSCPQGPMTAGGCVGRNTRAAGTGQICRAERRRRWNDLRQLWQQHSHGRPCDA